MDIDEEANTPNPIFDARQQYYRLWLSCSAIVKQSAMGGDTASWLRGLQLMFNHVYPLLNSTEQKDIDKKLIEAVGIEKTVHAHNRRDPNFQAMYHKKRIELETALLGIERDIMVAMNAHNMLLPRQVDDSDFTEDELEDESG